MSLTFKDGAPLLQYGNFAVTGTYSPTDVDVPLGFLSYDYGLDIFPAPAPAGAPENSLSIFSGESPLGNWNLYVQDDYVASGGSIASGWKLTFHLNEPPKVKVGGGKSRVFSGRYKIRGTCTDDFSDVKAVYVRANRGPLRLAFGTKRWTTTVRLKPGGNVIKIFSEDGVGNRSTIARTKVRYIGR